MKPVPQAAPVERSGARAPTAAALRLQLGIVAGLLLAANLFLIGWLWSPYAPSRGATAAQLAAAQSQLASMRQQDRQLRALSGQIRIGQRQAAELLETGMPPEAGASSVLLAELDRVAGGSGAAVSAATFSPDQDAHAGLRRVKIEIGLSGTYNAVVRFINGIEQSPVFFLIDQVNASSAHNAGPAATAMPVRLQIELEAYVRTGGASDTGNAGGGE